MCQIFPVFYAAPISYYKQFIKYKSIKFEIFENFTKQTYRNRTHISVANGIKKLIIPINKNSSKTKIKDLKISNQEKWQQIHWKTLVSAYNLSPFFEYYDYLFKPIYEKKYNYILDFNIDIHQIIKYCIQIEINESLTSEFYNSKEKNFKKTFSAKKTPSNLYQPYQQVFINKNLFLPNLSILDLLFNLGPQTEMYLKENRLV